MAHENPDDGLIRRYLLAQLGEDELQQLEERIMVDTELFNRVLLVEDELVEEYVQRELPESDRERFEDSFLSTPEGRRQVIVAKELRETAFREHGGRSPVTRREREEKEEPTAIDRERNDIKKLAGETVEGATTEDPVFPKRPQVGTARWPRWWSLPAFRFGAAAMMMIGLGLGIWRVFFFQSEIDKGMEALNRAYKQQRPAESRISGFGYAAASVTRGGPQKVDTVSLNRAERILFDEALENPSAASHHALGRLYLAEKKFDDAIKQFDEALKAQPINAQLQSDYGVLLLEVGKSGRSKEESGPSLEIFSRALDHLTRALELDGRLQEALYNRALLYEEMKLPPQAEGDWRRYLDIDRNSKWSDEAREHLKTIEGQRSKSSQNKQSLYNEFIGAYRAGNDDRAWEAFSRCRVRAGNFITEKLIDSYLEQLTRHEDDQANDSLKALAYAGELESRRVADRFTLDLARFYRTAASTEHGLLMAARASVKVAQKQIAKPDMHGAHEEFMQAKRCFDRLGDTSEATSAGYWLGICASQIDPQRGVPAFQELTRECERQGYKSLAIRSLNGLANSHLVLNSYSKAISYSRPSLNLARETQDSIGCALALSHLIGAYKPLGNFDECLKLAQAYLELAASHAIEPVQACVAYAQAAWVLNACDLNVAAFEYQTAALEMALDLDELTMICTSYAHLSMIEVRLKDYAGALMNANRALEIAGERSTEPAGLKMKAYSLLHLASVYRQSGDMDSAIANYNQSIELYDRMGYPAFVYLARKGLFASLAASGNTWQAKDELDRTILYFEAQRTRIIEQSNRDSFFDLEQDVYDLAIDYESVKLNNAQAAFEYSELSRGRSLLAALYQGNRVTNGVSAANEVSNNSSRPLNLVEIQDRLPDDVQVVQYAVLEDEVISWVITKNSFTQVRSDITSKELTTLVQECLRLAQDPTSRDDLTRVNSQLYDVLIAPVEARLNKSKQLFIIPDKILNFLPFQILVSSSNGYLITNYDLALSPSCSVLIACSYLAREKARIHEECVLSVGITRFVPREDDRLADLPSAAKEARDIASLYKGSNPLIEGNASKSAVMSGMSSAHVVHFASHFIRDPFLPVRSRLLLAKESQGTQDGRLSNSDLASSEILRQRLPSVRLAVLSACQTGVERCYRGEGASSIARAFITAGVPLVVASLWPVDSDATTELMIRFHRFRKLGGLASIQALRQAQRSMLGDSNNDYSHPYYWAAFNLTGGYAEF